MEVLMHRLHMDTVDGAGFKTKLATRAFTLNHCMHAFGGAQDGIDRTGLNTQCATDADLLIDDRYCRDILLFPDFLIQRDRVSPQQIGQGLNAGLASRRATIDLCFTCGNGFGIGATTGIAALSALGLRKEGIDLIDDRVGLYLEAYRGIAQQ